MAQFMPAKTSLLTELWQDQRTGRFFDRSTPAGAKIISIRRTDPDFKRVGMFSVQGGRWPIGVDSATADSSGDLPVGTTWNLAKQTLSSGIDFGGDGTSEKLTKLDTVLQNAERIPQSEVWHIKDIVLELLDADSDGADYEDDPDFLVLMQKCLVTLTINSQPVRLGQSAFDLLNRSRVEKGRALAGQTTGTTDVEWAVWSGERYPLLPYPLTLSDQDTFQLDIRVERAILDYAASDVVAIRADAIGTRYKWAGT